MSIEKYFQQVKTGALLNERQKFAPRGRDFHYLMTEMITPLVGATIVGGTIIGDGELDPHMPVLFIEQGGKKYSLIISSDDEMNDGGRIMIERGTDAFSPTAGA